MRQTILDSMARTLWVCAWADEHDERGDTPGQCELFDVADEPSPEALEAAGKLAARIEANIVEADGMPLADVWAEHARAAGLDASDTEHAERFGHYAAMQAQGHGVSWYDDHPEPDQGGICPGLIEVCDLRAYVA